MKRLLLSATALVALTAATSAADLPSRIASAPIVAAVPVFTWSGFYVGAQVGHAWSEIDTRASFADLNEAGDFEADGLVGGAHAGFNYQFGSVVVGVEGDIEAAGIDGERRFADLFGAGLVDTLAVESQINVQGSIRARLGLALDRALIYATGGVALAHVENTYTTTFNPAVPVSPDVESFESTEWGWTLGAGLEYAVTDHLTGRVEYRYTKFDTIRNAPSDDNPGPLFDNDAEQHTVRAGVSYRFASY
jgi:outer membrane immunogenic protein